MSSTPLSLTILSLEQATILPFMTLRLALEGARVIRVEAPPRGDPNRWVGPEVLAGERGMNAYYLPHNLGKEAITLDLGSAGGRALLHRLIRDLPVDVFATNQRPRSYQKLGIDYETLAALKPDLIWLGITGFGPDNDEAAYDPVLQARAGFMELTGEKEGEPMVFGLPMVDLGAGEHAYGQVMKALYQRERSGEGCRIDISMFQSALSWMNSPILLSQSLGLPTTRHGNTHPFFAPASVYPTADGYLYLAVGNDRQWAAIAGLPAFAGLARASYTHNAGRIADVAALNHSLAAITRTQPTAAWIETFNALGVPAAGVNTLPHVCADPLLADRMVRATDPRSGLEIAIPPPPVIPAALRQQEMVVTFPPRLGEHNAAIFGSLGLDAAELAAAGVI
jgi:formyl-CoA transferase